MQLSKRRNRGIERVSIPVTAVEMGSVSVAGETELLRRGIVDLQTVAVSRTDSGHGYVHVLGSIAGNGVACLHVTGDARPVGVYGKLSIGVGGF
jgi:hypothetical protein